MAAMVLSMLQCRPTDVAIVMAAMVLSMLQYRPTDFVIVMAAMVLSMLQYRPTDVAIVMAAMVLTVLLLLLLLLLIGVAGTITTGVLVSLWNKPTMSTLSLCIPACHLDRYTAAAAVAAVVDVVVNETHPLLIIPTRTYPCTFPPPPLSLSPTQD